MIITTRPCGTSAISTAAARAVATGSRPPNVIQMPIVTGTAAIATRMLIARITLETSRWSGVASSRNARAALVSLFANDSEPTRVAR